MGGRHRAPARREWVEPAAALALYAAALAVNALAVRAVGPAQVLTGEEMSVSIRDVLYTVEQRAQASVWSTNVGAPVFYWLASHLDPAYSLFSARRWKAAAMALLAPLLYLVLRRRLGCARGTALLGGATVALLPGVAMFGWLATENGLEAVLGTAGLYLATSARGWRWAAPVLAGLAVSTHTAGVAWAVVVVGVCLWRAVRAGPVGHRVVGALVVLVVPAAIVLSPLLWWTAGPERIVAGGGALDTGLLRNLAELVEQLAVSADSYYFFGDQPALGSPVLAGAVVVAASVATARRPVRPWLAVALATVAMWLPAGNLPGVRRAVALSVVAALVLAVAVDVLWRLAPRPVALVPLALAAAILWPLAVTAADWQRAHAGGERRLVADFPIPPGPMPATFARWDAQLRGGQLDVPGMVAEHDGLRTLAVVWLLADRSGHGTAGLPDPRRIVEATVPGPPRPSAPVASG